MKIPDQLQIAGMTYTIKKVNPECPELSYGNLNGCQSKQTYEIFLNELLNEQHMDQTFVHESVHGILDSLDISDQQILLDERFVESFSQLLYQVIKQI